MSAERTLQIFRPGTHRTAAGESLSFDEADLQATVAAYNPSIAQAPIVVGHPKTDAPAYGWVAGLAMRDGVLEATPDQVEPQFAELVNAGRYKKISAAFYPPAHPANPVPGVYYLRHVGFLGAQAPAVKGLRDASFADSEVGVIEIEFSAEAWGIARVFRSLREWLLTKFTPEDADQIVPDYVIQELDAAARADMRPLAVPSFAEPPPVAPTPSTEESPMTEAEKTALAAREAALNAKETEFAEREARIAAGEMAARRAETVEFVERLVVDGRVLPLDRAALVEFMAEAPEIEFTEGDDTVTKPRGEWFRAWLARLPKQVEFREIAGATRAEQPVEFAAPSGYGVDPAQLALHRKAQAYLAEHPKASYTDAVNAVRNS